ncbi:hypothetical protein J7E73_02155 [Paenibacillus albidus]|uniref:hypothetical protein n=1 Tax=Paenibacillus albidus TaxID=2041023 RepID=UPI001BE96199|nr:hypothetical protein [Paenibacillus albidus]MBT2287950.1 hypothetical protein [Paenibacillus albidus]
MELEEKIKTFITAQSALDFFEGSTAVVEGGAYSWRPLSSAGAEMQYKLCKEYVELAAQGRLTLEQKESPYLKTFDESYHVALGYLYQQDLVFVPTLEEVFGILKKEIDLQRFLIIQALAE